MKSLTKSVSALAITAMIASAAVTTTLIATPDVAYAKGNGGGNGNGNDGDNGNSGGNGNGNSGGNGNGKGADNGNKGGNSAKSNSGSNARSGGSGNGKLFGIFSVGKKKEHVEKPKPATAKKEAKLVAGMSPNQLGSMNGALNANINAILAHIRNGNTGGPVGALAGLAAADSLFTATGATVTAAQIITLDTLFDVLEAELSKAGYASVADYYAALDGGGIDPNDTIEALLEEDGSVLPENEAALATALADAGFSDLQGYNDALAGPQPVGDLDDAITDLGGNTGGRQDLTATPPTDDQVAAAETVITAEGDMLSAWNKSGDATDQQKSDLIAALRDRLAADSAAIDDAVSETTEPTTLVVTTE